MEAPGIACSCKMTACAVGQLSAPRLLCITSSTVTDRARTSSGKYITRSISSLCPVQASKPSDKHFNYLLIVSEEALSFFLNSTIKQQSLYSKGARFIFHSSPRLKTFPQTVELSVDSLERTIYCLGNPHILSLTNNKPAETTCPVSALTGATREVSDRPLSSNKASASAASALSPGEKRSARVKNIC